MTKRILSFLFMLLCFSPLYSRVVHVPVNISSDTVQYSDEEEYEGEDDEGGEEEQENEEEES